MRISALTIARQEFVLNSRNRWVHSFAALFGVLTLTISYFGMVTSGYSGFQDFTRTAASITTLSGFLIPLYALVLGVFSFLHNRAYMELLVAQPVSRSQVLLGKYMGLLLTVVGSILVGLGLPGAVISLMIGIDGAIPYALVVLHCVVLSAIFTGMAVVIVLLCRRRPVALGVAFGVWLIFELLYDVAMLGSTLYFTPSFLKVFMLVGILGNPIDITRVLSLLAVGGPHLFGPGGATLIKLTGSSSVAFVVGWAGLALWATLPVLVARLIFTRQDV